MLFFYLEVAPQKRQKLDKLASDFKGVTNMAGKLSFHSRTSNSYPNLDVMLAMDSGNGHLTALYDIPVVTIWGVTHPFLGFAPFNQPNENQLLADRTKYPFGANLSVWQHLS